MNKTVKKGSNGFQTGNVVIVSIAHLIHDIYTSFLAPVLPLLIDKLGISLFQSGLLAVVQRIPSLFNPFVGIIAEKLKARYFIIFAPAVTTISMGLIGVAPSYTILVVLLFVSGISSTLFHVPSPVMIKKLSGNRLGMGMSFFMVGGEFARTLGPLLVVAAVEIWGLNGTFRLIPFGLIASAILWLNLRKISISKDIKAEKGTNYFSVFRKFLPIFISLAGITFFRGAMKSSLTLYLPVYLTGKGAEIWMAGISLAALQLAGAIGTFYSGSLSDRIGRRTTLVIVSVVSPLLMLLFLKSSGTLSFILLLVMGFFLVAPQSVNLAVIHELKTPHLPFVNGVYMMINFFISSVITMAVGALSDRIGLDRTYTIAAFLAFPSIIFAFFIPRKEKSVPD
ncbi:MAG: MFS transporter [Marinilabiliaceae bacterium]|jgi:FSR family fosmidomycin resistance protein-like MFS transporter|nr:MFS transporter [Marinilabiliaceae bacterium]